MTPASAEYAEYADSDFRSLFPRYTRLREGTVLVRREVSQPMTVDGTRLLRPPPIPQYGRGTVDGNRLAMKAVALSRNDAVA